MKFVGVLVLLFILVVPRYVSSRGLRHPRQFTGNAMPGTFTENKMAAAPSLPLPFSLQECTEEPEIPQAKVSCEYSGCRVECEDGYKTASGLGLTTLECDHSSGQLTVEGIPWQTAGVACLPDCGVASCLNGGQCIQPMTCQCTRGYTGQNCEVPPEEPLVTLPAPEPDLNAPNTCPDPDFPVLNAEVSRAGEQLIVRCNEGFAFKIGGTVAFIQCRGGDWDHPSGIFSTGGALVCLEKQCNPPCLNGGVCLPEGVCDCPYKYWGAACQQLRCSLPDATALTHASLGGVHTRMKIQCHPRHKMLNNRRTQTILCRNGMWELPGQGLLQDNDVKCYSETAMPAQH